MSRHVACSSLVPFIGSKLGTVAQSLHQLAAMWFPQALSLPSPSFPISILFMLLSGLSVSYLILTFTGPQASPLRQSYPWFSQCTICSTGARFLWSVQGYVCYGLIHSGAPQGWPGQKGRQEDAWGGFPFVEFEVQGEGVAEDHPWGGLDVPQGQETPQRDREARSQEPELADFPTSEARCEK